MRKVDQQIVCPETGDCARAVVASLLGLDLDQVPNFRRFPEDEWFNVFWYFLYSLGWEYVGEAKPSKYVLLEEDSIDGFFDATVASKTFPEQKHAVILDMTGTVVHDPNPNKLWLGENVVESGELLSWFMFKRREEGK